MQLTGRRGLKLKLLAEIAGLSKKLDDARKNNEYDQESFECERYQFNQAQQRFEWERCNN